MTRNQFCEFQTGMKFDNDVEIMMKLMHNTTECRRQGVYIRCYGWVEGDMQGFRRCGTM